MVQGALLEVEARLGPEDSRSHRSFPFELPPGARELELELAFEPAMLEDEVLAARIADEAGRRFGIGPEEASLRAREGLRNLLTLSLGGPGPSFRGCAHRQGPRVSAILSADAASPGFLPGPLTAGAWRATVSVHCVASPSCIFRLKARAR